MKKTMIALALAATAVSGSAMAWTVAGTGGNIELGGSIQVTPYSTPWEVMVGAPATGIDASITKGTSAVVIPVTNAIPVLGIRTASNQPIQGTTGISPEIDYHGAIGKFANGVTTLTLDVREASGTTKIGRMTAPLTAAAVASNKKMPGTSSSLSEGVWSIVANPGYIFHGGLPNTNDSSQVINGFDAAKSAMSAVMPDILANFNDQGYSTGSSFNNISSANTGFTISAAYASGIKAGSEITLALTTAAANDAIKWKASMPITVSYQ